MPRSSTVRVPLIGCMMRRLPLTDEDRKWAEEAIAKLKTVLERIGRPHGCWQKCHCDSQAELLIWKEAAKSAANEALKGGE